MRTFNAVSVPVLLLALLAFSPLEACARDAGKSDSAVTGSPASTTAATSPAGGMTPAEKNDAYKNLQLFADVFQRVREEYVDEKSNKELTESALDGMLSALDPHSGYLNKKDFDDMKVQTRGEFGGLGIEVTLEDKLIKVISPIDDTPAAKAGMQPGDLITHIDGKLVTELTLNEAVDRMRGKPGSEVTLTVRRGGIAKAPIDVKLKRAIIKIVSVRSRVIDNVGYIRITTFNEQTASGLDKALKDIGDKAGKSLQGYVLDLRNDPGGLLDQSIAVASTFLPDGAEVVSTRGRQPQDNTKLLAKGGDRTGGKPMVVLINSGSASASEIVAGALQDYKRAIVLGTKSFGKGSVQTIMPVSEDAAIRLTTARYYTPSGRSIQGLGIEPDIKIEPAKVESLSTDDKDILRESDLKGALKNDQAKGDPKDKATETTKPDSDAALAPGESKPSDVDKSATPKSQPLQGGALGKEDDPSRDYQLMRAIDLLRGISLYGQRSNMPAALPAAASVAATPATPAVSH